MKHGSNQEVARDAVVTTSGDSLTSRNRVWADGDGRKRSERGFHNEEPQNLARKDNVESGRGCPAGFHDTRCEPL